MPRISLHAALAAVAVALSLTPRARAQSEAVSATSAHFEAVVTAGTERFTVQLDGVPATVVPPERGAVSAVDVDGVLAFTAESDAVPYILRRVVVTANGLVQLGEASRISAVRRRGADAVLDAEIGDGVTIRGVLVPLEALTFGPRPARSSELPQPACGERNWSTTGQRVVRFHAQPGGAGAHVAVAFRAGTSTFLCEIGHRAGWVHVATIDTVHLDAQITGWVAQASLRRLRGGIGFTGGSGTLPEPEGSRGRVSVAGPGVYQGPARLDPGTRVHASPEGASWATVRDGTATIEVIVRDGEPWAQLVGAPGLGLLTRAWVRSDAVHRP